MGARRVQAGALAALGALLLLLMARRPAPPHAPPLPHTLLISSTTPPPTNTTTSSVSSIRVIDSSSVSSHNQNASSSIQTKSPTKPQKKPQTRPHAKLQTPINRVSSITKKKNNTHTPQNNTVILTKDIYEAGHETPHPELCPALGEDIKVLILVSSAPAHAPARDAVRLTWGHYAARKDIALAFVLGSPAESLRAAIANEDNMYGDIIIGRSKDSYSNLTLKTVSMLEWADTYCPRAPRILKTDDDMFINIPKLLQFMETNGRANATMTIWGKVLKRALPKRAPNSKYYLSTVQFPNKTLPDFATGPAYLLTQDAASALLKAAPREPYIRLEDVFITGVVAGKLGLKRIHSGQFYNKRVALHPCAIQRGISIHMVRYHEQFDLWRKLLDDDLIKKDCPEVATVDENNSTISIESESKYKETVEVDSNQAKSMKSDGNQTGSELQERHPNILSYWKEKMQRLRLSISQLILP